MINNYFKILFTILLFKISISYAGIFTSKEGKTFQTRGTAVILNSGALTPPATLHALTTIGLHR